MSDIKKLEAELNQMIATGKGFPDGFEKFYADGVVMMEGNGESYQGKEVNRKREMEFLSNVQEFHGARLVAVAAEGDVGFSEWEYEVTFKGGKRVTLQQVARRRWKDGKVVHERFYYNPQAMA
ncbi:MAG TPA: nuclear transport factor 2 family protein [Candidatus Acidoferrum sp.]|nr:nuclear transport factor 2 family protein [Candidatus Acidoferrum sp.]